MTKVLVYYYAFPHYRLEILKDLEARAGANLTLAAGIEGRESIKPLTRKDIPILEELPSIKFGPFTWQKGIFGRATASEFDAVILGPATLSLTTWSVLIMRKLRGRRTYLWGQGGRTGERTPKRFLQEIMNRVASGLLVYGQSDLRAATELGLESAKISIVHNATRTNEEFLDPVMGLRAFKNMKIRADDAVNQGEMTIIYVGRLIPAKKVEVLLDGARIIRSKFGRLRVIIVGGGPEQEALHLKYPDDFIEYRGWIYDPEELNAAISNATFVVSPYTIGLLAIDALRNGTPVLYPDHPFNGAEVEALTLGVNALKFAAGESNAIADAVNHWLSLAPEISQEEFIYRRSEALRTWSPANVASRILSSIGYQ